MGQPHKPGPGNYPRRPGAGMDTGARATTTTNAHDGIANCSDCKATLSNARARMSRARGSIMGNTMRGMNQAERPSSMGGVHGSKKEVGQPHNPCMSGYGKRAKKGH